MNIEITPEEMSEKRLSSYILVHMRNKRATDYGIIPGAVCIQPSEFDSHVEEWRGAGVPVIVYCMTGEQSLEPVKKLRSHGIEAYSLAGGYSRWVVFDI